MDISDEDEDIPTNTEYMDGDLLAEEEPLDSDEEPLAMEPSESKRVALDVAMQPSESKRPRLHDGSLTHPTGCDGGPVGLAPPVVAAPRELDSGERFKLWKRGQKLGEGCFGNVFIATHERTGERAALKKIKLECEDEGVPGMTLREISLLQELHHPNVVELKDVFYLPLDNKLYLCFEYCDFDLKKYMKSQQYRLSAACIQSFAYQLLLGLAHCHSHRICHRDLKPQNVLVDPKRGTLKLADFGLARAFTVPLRAYTHEVVTLWYRAPEILLGGTPHADLLPLVGHYSVPVDVWSVGTILAEMATGVPLFPGGSEIEQLLKIFKLLGTPDDSVWPGVTQLPDFTRRLPKWRPTSLRETFPSKRLDDAGLDLTAQMLRYVPNERPAAKNALDHPYFTAVNKATVGTIPLPF